MSFRTTQYARCLQLFVVTLNQSISNYGLHQLQIEGELAAGFAVGRSFCSSRHFFNCVAQQRRDIAAQCQGGNHATFSHQPWPVAERQATILQVDMWPESVWQAILSVLDSCCVPTVCRCLYFRLLPYRSRSNPRLLARVPSQQQAGEAGCASSDLD